MNFWNDDFLAPANQDALEQQIKELEEAIAAQEDIIDSFNVATATSREVFDQEFSQDELKLQESFAETLGIFKQQLAELKAQKGK